MDQGGDTYQEEQDKSMNRDEGSYQLSHIYDNLFAPNPSGERRLNRPFRRRPPSRPKHQLNLKRLFLIEFHYLIVSNSLPVESVIFEYEHISDRTVDVDHTHELEDVTLVCRR